MPEKRPPQLVDQRLLKALSHPTRILILDILSEGNNSPTGIQRRIGDVSLNLLTHHIKVLRDLGCIKLVEKVPKRGATEHIYEVSERQFLTVKEWEAVDSKHRRPITSTIMRTISEDTGIAFADGRFDERTDNHLSRSPLELDEKGWSEVVSALAKALDKVLEADEKSKKRAEEAGTEDDLFPARVVIMQFPFGKKTG